MQCQAHFGLICGFRCQATTEKGCGDDPTPLHQAAKGGPQGVKSRPTGDSLLGLIERPRFTPRRASCSASAWHLPTRTCSLEPRESTFRVICVVHLWCRLQGAGARPIKTPYATPLMGVQAQAHAQKGVHGWEIMKDRPNKAPRTGRNEARLALQIVVRMAISNT